MSERPRILLRARGGRRYGWGHLVRCDRLARILDGVAEVTLLAEGDAGVRQLAGGVGRWHPGWRAVETPWAREAEVRWLEALRPDAIVVDEIALEPARRALYRARAPLLCVFSDLGAPQPGADLVVCPAGLDTAAGDGARWLRGPRYAVLDPPEAGRPRAVAPAARRLLVMLGGALAPEAEGWLADFAREAASLPLETRILAGFDRGEALADRVREAGPRVVLVEGRRDAARWMRTADLALSASGFARFELAALGTPALLVSIVAHQDALGQAFAADTGAARFLGRIGALSPGAAARAVAALAADRTARQALARAGPRAVDGRGAARIADALVRALPTAHPGSAGDVEPAWSDRADGAAS